MPERLKIPGAPTMSCPPFLLQRLSLIERSTAYEFGEGESGGAIFLWICVVLEWGLSALSNPCYILTLPLCIITPDVHHADGQQPDYCSMQRVVGRIPELRTVRCTVAFCTGTFYDIDSFNNLLKRDKSLVMSFSWKTNREVCIGLWVLSPFYSYSYVLRVYHWALVTSHGT